MIAACNNTTPASGIIRVKQESLNQSKVKMRDRQRGKRDERLGRRPFYRRNGRLFERQKMEKDKREMYEW